MRYTITLLATFLIAGLAPVTGQETAKERAANLRTQLIQVQTQQEELQTRLRQLEEDMKPENIEKTLAGVGSTHPEDLREQRRRQLEIEKTSVQSRLNILSASRTRLETRLAQADNDAYLESAGVSSGGTRQPAAPRHSRHRNSSQAGAQPGTTNSATVPTARRRARRPPGKRSKSRRLRRPGSKASSTLSANFGVRRLVAAFVNV